MFTIHSVLPEGAQKCRGNAVPKTATPSQPNQPRTRLSSAHGMAVSQLSLGKRTPCCFRSRTVASWPIPRILSKIELVVPIIENIGRMSGYMWGELPGYNPMIHLLLSPGCERVLGFSLWGGGQPWRVQRGFRRMENVAAMILPVHSLSPDYVYPREVGT